MKQHWSLWVNIPHTANKNCWYTTVLLHKNKKYKQVLTSRGYTGSVVHPGTHFTKGSWAHNWNLMKLVLLFLILILMIQSGHNFAQAMTAKLSWLVQNCDMDIYFFKCKSNLNFCKIWIMSTWSVCETSLCDACSRSAEDTHPGISLGMRPVNERCHYNVTTSFIGWVHTKTDPCLRRIFNSFTLKKSFSLYECGFECIFLIYTMNITTKIHLIYIHKDLNDVESTLHLVTALVPPGTFGNLTLKLLARADLEGVHRAPPPPPLLNFLQIRFFYYNVV